jgi:hypothetical protein
VAPDFDFPKEDLILEADPLPPALGGCMVCGQANPHGIHLRFRRLRRADGTVVGVGAECTPPPHFQGFDEVLHGGAITALLDDAMWWAVYSVHESVTVTADMRLRFRRPIPMNTALRVEGVTAPGRRLYQTAGRLSDMEGNVLALAWARFVTTSLRPPQMANGRVVPGI